MMIAKINIKFFLVTILVCFLFQENFSQRCTVSVTVSPSTTTFVVGATNCSLTSTPVGGVPPYTYYWEPNVYFVGPSTNTSQNPVVNPPISIVYTVTVIDNSDCSASATVEVIAKPYALLNKTPDGEYYKLADNKLLFKYDEQYAATSLVYYVMNKTHSVVASYAVNNISSSLVVNMGDNRYYLDAAALPTGYYTLEVINEKKEKLYLRFKR
ncbi:MAG: hypothetical protein Q8L81_10335 [Bacteroidota bacterium]|nr:hypothetical protein [Bacteroidota bacterium]